MNEDPGRYLASRILTELAAGSPREDLLAFCHRRGARVLFSEVLPRRAFYVEWPWEAILLRPDATVEDVRHELGHHVIQENSRNGIEYDPPDFAPTDEESACDRFAGYLAEP
jgi:hypothetical protein